jgi:hypothetical protein
MSDRKFTLTDSARHPQRHWLVGPSTPRQWDAYFEYGTGDSVFEEIYAWCESRWGHQYKNERWSCETGIGYSAEQPRNFRPARITIYNERDAFDFKMRWA